MSKYPEHAKLALISEKSQAIGEFLEWLQTTRHVQLCRYGEYDELYVIATSINDLLAEYYGIDRDRLETEKREMITVLREANG